MPDPGYGKPFRVTGPPVRLNCRREVFSLALRPRAIPASLVLLLLISCRSEPALPVLFILPETALLDEKGASVTLGDLKGTVGIHNFIFTTCAGICPMMTRRMREVTVKFDHDDPIRFYSLSVDPVTDTPPVLAAYALKFRNDPRWRFLTGERDEVIRLSIDGFKLAAGGAGVGTDRLLHTQKFALVDRQGRVRAYYDSSDPEAMKRLVGDAKRLVEEID